MVTFAITNLIYDIGTFHKINVTFFYVTIFFFIWYFRFSVTKYINVDTYVSQCVAKNNFGPLKSHVTLGLYNPDPPEKDKYMGFHNLIEI